MDVSVIILTWNSEKYIEMCLSSLIECFTKENLKYEIFLVDNGSTDNTIHLIKKIKEINPDKLHLFLLKKNYGTTLPRNLALKQAKGKFIIIIDSDVKVLDNTILRLIKTLEGRTDIGMVVPKIVYPDGTIQRSTDNFPTIFSKIYRYFFLKKLERMEAQSTRANTLTEVDYAISAMWVLKKEVLLKVGLLDEIFFYAPEDVDYCLRLHKAGFKILYDQSASVIHYTQEISRGFKLNRHFFEHLKGLYYYFKKHKYFFKSPQVHL